MTTRPAPRLRATPAPPTSPNALRALGALISWTATRNRYLLPAFSILQILLSASLIFGMTLFLGDVGPEETKYLSTGAWSLGIISVGAVVAPQVISVYKRTGLLDYQKAQPVPRFALLIAEATIWTLASIPGFVVGIAAAWVHFDLSMHVDVWFVLGIAFVIVAMVQLGYAMAFLLHPDVLPIVTQLVMLVGLLFSPIAYPAERLPAWAAGIHQVFPFTPVAEVVREVTFRDGDPILRPVLVLVAWIIGCIAVAYASIARRG
ncbi:ABC transporter permease [Corynebacterium otitidis]|uniref:ABC-2 type transporter transmembrane domain-containing protein n=1 Tax=Corynebacterium otitidis ATCC 51513 TaxID=883169 RepID=I7LC50_9CORY|nr:ABC transporter permease [Corynebacterium otitidis]EJZ81972.1 hypothetical protein HMPREF9719_01108 [Corynebacterium otitidis ATCC 51513]CCI83649.1 hypothetical protein BN46_0920 [Corynebacterium otitidis ATCC 51513]